MIRLFLKTLSIVLFGYAVFGRGFAYLGWPPLYAGEIAMIVGLLMFTADARVRNACLTASSATWLSIYLLCAWGLLRTVPYLSRYGVDALRDGVVWGYAGFALLLFSLIMAYPHNLWRLARGMRRFAGTYPLLIFIALSAVVTGISIPILSVTGLPLVVVKPGDVGVHLGGIVLLWLVGFAGPRGPFWMSLVLGSSFVAAVMSRAATLAFVTPTIVYILLRRSLPRRVRALALAGTAVFLMALILNPRVEVRPGRWLAPRQVVVNLASTVAAGDNQPEELQHTKVWRLAWWAEIVGYTIVGDRFWLGKGFGINLAADDGFMADDPRPNRYPHSVHMNFLARAGVPGLGLWLIVLVLWGRLVLGCHAHSRRVGQAEWSALFLFLFGYWSAFLVNASFDVFLEGPMGGVWFWSIMGAGLAATQIYARGCPWAPGVPEDASFDDAAASSERVSARSTDEQATDQRLAARSRRAISE